VEPRTAKHFFDDLKTALTTAPILVFLDFTQTFYLTTDTSKTAVACILPQYQEEKKRPIAYE
jgi:hypothetical protein